MRLAAGLPALALLPALAAPLRAAAAPGPRFLTPEEQAAVDAAFTATLPKAKVRGRVPRTPANALGLGMLACCRRGCKARRRALLALSRCLPPRAHCMLTDDLLASEHRRPS